MTFTSLSYFLFLPAAYLIFHFTADRWRWMVLLTASYGFYASFKAPYLLTVLLMVTGISYACALRIAAQQDETVRKRWLWTGSLACIAILAVMKYLPALESGALSATIISIGVSYFTFQAISYMADIYLEIEEPEHHFGHYALYMAFFPKLLQGPIERAGDLLPQFKLPYQFDYHVMRSGLLLFAWGLFKKVVVADRIAPYANQVYNNVHDYSGLALLLGTYAYALQIYFDFSAYTDMARGTGRMFGVKLTENFDRPYLATSVADFWRRWHISFSRWILDYIFKPLQMGWRNGKNWGTAAALITAFLISGAWHGASWGFVIWGGLHGLYMACSVLYKPYQKKCYQALGIEKNRFLKYWQIFVTFNLVSFAWIFFRANSLDDAKYVITNMAHGLKGLGSVLKVQGASEAVLVAVALAFFLVASKMFRQPDFRDSLPQSAFQRYLAYNSLVFMILFLAKYSATKNFIYFQF